MPACSSYCDFGESFSTHATATHGLPRCIMGTIPPVILLVWSLVLALLYIHKRRQRSYLHRQNDFAYEDLESGINTRKCDIKCNRLDDSCQFDANSAECINNPAKFVRGENQSSFLYALQQFLHICVAALPVIDLVIKASANHDRLQGYILFNDCATFVTWLVVLFALQAESKIFYTAHISRHSIILFLFWTLAFVNENLAFISWNNDHWWFLRENKNQIAEFGLFVVRYVCIALIFLFGMFAPGLYKPPAEEILVVDEEISTEGRTRQRTESAFKGLWRKSKMLWPFLWPSERLLQLRVVICFLLLGIGRALNVLVPYTYKLIVDYLTPGQEKVIKEPWKLVLIYVSLRFLQGGGTAGIGVISNLRSFLWIKIQQFTSRTLQVRLFDHLHSLSLRWHLARRTGEVIRMVDRGANSIYQLLSYILFNIFPMIADIVVAIVYFSLYFNGWFGLIVFITMACYIAFTIIITEWRTKFRREMNEKDNTAKAKAVDSLLNFETVKYYGGEDYEVGRLNQAIMNYQESEWQTIASLNVLNQAQNIVITLGLLAGTLYCAYLVVDGTLMVGDFVMFITYIVQLYVPLNYFGTYYRMIQQAFIDMENMFDLFQQKREVRDIPDAPPLQVTNGLIEFRDVNFSYQPERQILKDISFRVYPGQTVALVGHTGSGKSTVIRLLYRFYDIDSGSILIDGQDITKVTQKSLRHQIGVVPQDTVLFNDDIGFNIRYGRMDADDKEVEQAAAAADIHSRIQTFPNGYKTLVGERGLKLSGGEKQRVAIARTVLKNPPLVLLDEATSALDTQTERNIQASLNSVTINRTTIVVAHRLSTIVNADQILVLCEGEIIERGTHDELMAAEGTYADMWNQQLKGMEKDDTGNGSINDVEGKNEKEKSL